MEGLPERAVPYNIEAERSVLGAIFIHRDAIISVASWLHPEDFYREAHAWIYEAQLTCYHRREPPDLVTVAAELERCDRLQPAGGMTYLSSVVDAVPTAVHVEYYGRIVERGAVLRRLISAGGRIAAIGYEGPEGVDEALSRAEEMIFAISQRRVTRDFVPIRDVTSDYFDRLSRLRATHGTVIGVPTGFHDLDHILGGLQRSDLVILAARPTAGKTSLALSIAYNAAIRDDGGEIPVGIFSLEMSQEQLLQRFLAMKTEINQQRLRRGQLNDDEFQRVSEAMGELSESPIFIDDTPGIGLSEMRSKARRLHAEEGVDLIVVDYLQLIQSRRTDSRVQEISEISRTLKALARELDVPVLALSQLSRAVEHRTPHIPMLSDLRESGCLAGDSRVYLPDKGSYVPIRDLVGQAGFRVTGVNTQTYKLEPATVTNAFCTGVKPVYRLITRLGRTVRATANHKFLTIHGWKRLDELEGECIALPRSLARPSTQSMAESDVYWDRVKSIEADGSEEVFDLTVDGLHCFVANDIILHNSIEQDADVVMFIYREDMYDPDTDKPGVAEIHIAKHRNGPTGKAYLFFRKEMTRFENLERFLTPEGGGYSS